MCKGIGETKKAISGNLISVKCTAITLCEVTIASKWKMFVLNKLINELKGVAHHPSGHDVSESKAVLLN